MPLSRPPTDRNELKRAVQRLTLRCSGFAYPCIWINRAAERFDETPETTKQTTNLTTLELLEEETTVYVNQRHLDVDPYPDKTPKELLTREYLVVNEKINTTTRKVYYPEALLQDVACITHSSKGFRYFRGDMKVRVTLISNSHVYGCALVSTLPYMDPATVPQKYASVTQQVQADGRLIDISQQEALEMHLPYIYPERFREIATLKTARQWCLSVQPLCLDTIASSTPAEFTLQIYASYEKPKLSGYRAAEFQSSRASTLSMRDVPTYAQRLGFLASAATTIVGSGIRDAVYSGPGPTVTGALGEVLSQPTVSLSEAAKMVSQGSNLYDKMVKKNENKSVKPQMCPDMNGDGEGILPFLGDMIRGDKKDLPDVRNLYNITKICETPAYAGTVALKLVSDAHTIESDAALSHSYFSFFKRMFKWVRYDTKMYFKITTAPDVSAKLNFTTKPARGNNGDVGDLPISEITIQGSTTHSIIVPFMEMHHWLEDEEEPTAWVRMSLSNSIPHLWDKDLVVYVSIFLAPVNLQFGSLQSPCNTAVMQSTFASQFKEPVTFGSSYESTYMGGYNTVYDLMKRYSSRDVNEMNMFPFPIELDDKLYQFDIFDYVAQLYAFYTGSMDVKYGLTQAPTQGLLSVVMGNTHGATTHGNTMKGGNSMILTSQTIWPVLEFNYPFERRDEFDSIAEPSVHIAPLISDLSTVSSILTRPGLDFSFFTLMPTPDWSDTFAVFQASVPRLAAAKSFYIDTLVSQDTTVQTDLILPNTAATRYFDVDLVITRTSGSVDFDFAAGIHASGVSPSNISQVVTGSVLSAAGTWVDVNNSGKNSLRLKFEGANSDLTSTSGWRLFMRSAGAVTCKVVGTVNIRPYGMTTIPLTPGYAGSAAQLAAGGDPIPVNVGTTPIPVAFDSTISVSVENEPLSVIYSSLDPLPVSIENEKITAAITGTVLVSGAPQQADPIWTTPYHV